MKDKSVLKIGLITSRGGHLFQLCQLKKWWQNYSRFWVTAPGGDTDFFLKNETIYYGYFPEQKNIINALKNFFLAFRILRQEKPDLLISTGAGIAPPFFLMGKLLGIKLIFIEPIDFIHFPTLSGRLVSPFVNLMLVQNKKQLKFFKNAKLWGKTI